MAQTAKSCYYQLRNIGQIRSSITEGACRTLVHALVTSRLDYGNGLLYGIPQVTIQRLQRIQNCAARIVTRTGKYEHITPVLRLLHWLPVRQRALFKVLAFTYKAFHNLLPTNVLSYFKKVNDSHNHNTRKNTLSFKVRYRRTSKKALSIWDKGSKMWNALSADIKLSRNVNVFKKMLKASLLENYKF